jgi:hypothetical protein
MRLARQFDNNSTAIDHLRPKTWDATERELPFGVKADASTVEM